MSNKITVSAEQFDAEIAEVLHALDVYTTFWQKVNKGIGAIINGMDPVLQRNIEGKLSFAMETTGACGNSLMVAMQTLQNCKETYESADAYLARLALEENPPEHGGGGATLPTVEPVDLDSYCEKVSNAEYARLCHRTSRLLEGFSNPTAKDFIDAIRQDTEYFCEGDPIRNLTEEQVTVISDINGFGCVVIEDGNKAMVIFAGTNDIHDIGTDALLALSQSSPQAVKAIAVVNDLSKKYDDIVVTGHSLGGYLATSATLQNKNVSKCVAFDPPGRYDTKDQMKYNYEQFSKVITYEANGSPISGVVGRGVGSVIPIDVKENWIGIVKNHGIVEICDALNENDAIAKTWN